MLKESSPKIALYAHPQLIQTAEQLARRFNLPLAGMQGKGSFRLYLGPDRLELQDLKPNGAGPLYVDFVTGRARHRRLFGGGKRQPLARAVGIKADCLPRVLDATAGLGRDAFVLASLGCQVTLVERSPVLAALLYDALERAALDHEISTIAARMSLVFADSKNYLLSLSDTSIADTIYLDPMYPHRKKSALIKKEMRISRDLVGDDEDANELLEIALSKTMTRVVVKRPRSAATLNALKPTAIIQSEHTRYDIYIKSTQSIPDQ